MPAFVLFASILRFCRTKLPLRASVHREHVGVAFRTNNILTMMYEIGNNRLSWSLLPVSATTMNMTPTICKLGVSVHQSALSEGGVRTSTNSATRCSRSGW